MIIPTPAAPSRTKGPSSQGPSPHRTDLVRDNPGVGISRISPISDLCDNYATRKTPAIHQWLLKHPRFHLHFTPASSSWLNLVVRWFAELTNRKLRRSAHRSVTELETDIRKWINEWNKAPRPFVWTKSADEILGTLAAYCERINDSGH